MRTWQLWAPGKVLRRVEGIEPLLASWNRKTDPAQVRLQAYLEKLEFQLGALPSTSARLFLEMDIDVKDPVRLLHHYDLENYLTPVVSRLGAARFEYVGATKRVGGGSEVRIGLAEPLEGLVEIHSWEHFSCSAGAGAQGKQWKAGLRAALTASRSQPLPWGPAEVHLAWGCSPQRNWVWLWKPTGDAMGPVLGEPTPHNPFSPNDDRIVALGLHLNSDDTMGHSVDVGMWWRPALSLTNEPFGPLPRPRRCYRLDRSTSDERHGLRQPLLGGDLSMRQLESDSQTRHVTALIEREGDGYTALCPELGIASQGDTIEEARRSLVEALELFFETASPAEVQERLHPEVYLTRLEVVVG